MLIRRVELAEVLVVVECVAEAVLGGFLELEVPRNGSLEVRLPPLQRATDVNAQEITDGRQRLIVIGHEVFVKDVQCGNLKP